MTVLDTFRLEGRRAFVTGGGRGIGRAFALALADAGADVAVLEIDPETAAAVAGEVERRGRRSAAITCDVTDSNQVAGAVGQVRSALGGVEIAVNNAGTVINVPAQEMTVEEWEKVIAVNLRGVFLCAREAGKVMLEQGSGGSIVNTASMSASIVNHPQPQSSYNASKAGVVALTRSLASEWAPAGIRVNCISPGYTMTELTSKPDLAPLRDHWASITPMKRMAQPDDLTGPLVFLASDASRFMTGHDLIVDGGYTVW